jgi:GNAT superfamily N-acetyltransferase
MLSELSTPDVLTAVTAATLARAQAVMADTTAWAAVNGLPSPPHDLPLYAAHGPAAAASAAFSADTVWFAQAWAAAAALLHGERSSRTGRVCVTQGSEGRRWATVVYPPGSEEEWQEVLDEVERLAGNGVPGRTLLASPWRTPDLRRRGWKLAGYPVALHRRPGGGCREVPAPDLVVCRAGHDAWTPDFVTSADLAADVTGALDGPWSADVLHWVARHGGETVAVASVVVSQGLWMPSAIAVRPDHRGRGIGQAVLAVLRPHLVEFPEPPSFALAPDHLVTIARTAGYRPRQRWMTWRR